MILAAAILFSIFFVLTLLAGLFMKSRKSDARDEADDAGPLPYRRLEYVTSRAERVFFDVLEGVLQHPTDPHGPRQMLVFPQVSLARVVQVEAGVQGWQKWHNKIDRKRVDFVLVDPISNKTRLVIELDDSSHLREDRQKRDGFVDAALRTAGVPLLRVPVAAQNRYDRAALAHQIAQAIKG